MKEPGKEEKKKRSPRQLAFRVEAMDSLLELSSNEQITLEKAIDVAKLDCKRCHLHEVNNPKSSNCRDNPFCIQRLGLEKLEKLELTKQKVLVETKETQKRRDLNDQPTGLVNSGNFCYVNSALQVWFNNPDFRQIVYDFRPSDQYIVPEYPKMNIEKVMSALQELFFTMETTPFETTDKNNTLIKLLRLNQEQQDAQEFTLMLFNALDRNLLLHPNGKDIRNRLNELYTGTVRYKTFCQCGQQSIKEEPSTSLQINIENQNTLMDALNAHFGVDRLDDYRCSACQERGNVSRQCDYVKLPPVIIVQINRFAYDPKKGRRKLKTRLEYPREIEGSAFIRDAEGRSEDQYELFAVMIHEGNNISYGHYYDLVRNPFNRRWYKYDDEKVEYIQKPPGTEKSTSGKSMIRKPESDQVACYGLLYMKKSAIPIAPFEHPPLNVIGQLRNELEENYVGMVSENVAGVRKSMDRVARRVEQLRSCWEKLETHEANFNDPSEIAFLPTDLLIDILSKEFKFLESGKGEQMEPETNGNKTPEPRLNGSSKRVTRAKNGVLFGSSGKSPNSPAKNKRKSMNAQVAETLGTFSYDLCPHGKVPIDVILYGDVKAVSRNMTMELLRKYEYKLMMTRDGEEREIPLPTGSDLCIDCVKALRDEARFIEALNEDEKLSRKILKEVKQRCSVKGPAEKLPEHVYISKVALANFKKDAQQERKLKLGEQETEILLIFKPGQGSEEKEPRDTDNDTIQKKARIEENEFTDNPNLNPTREYSATELPTNLIEMDDGPPTEPMDSEMMTNGICDEMAHELREETGIEFNQELKCPHGGINYDQFRHSASPDEWFSLTKYFSRAFRVKCDDNLCPTCHQKEMDAHVECMEAKGRQLEVRRDVADVIKKIEARKQTDQLKYAVCSVVIRNLKNMKSRRTTPSTPSICQKCVLCEEHEKPFLPLTTNPDEAGLIAVTEDEWKVIVESMKILADEVDFDAKTVELNEAKLVDFCEPCYNDYLKAEEIKSYQYEEADVFVKMHSGLMKDEKSTRRVAKKNLYKIKGISSTSSLLQLKVAIYSQTGQTPMDQLLYKEFGGEILDNVSNHHTLSELKIAANNQEKPLILITQDVNTSTENVTEEPVKIRELERGFGDTALAH